MGDDIVLSHATKVIKGRVVLDDVSLRVRRGGVYGFTGVNGSGKTMVFRAISGLIHLTSGEVEVFGRFVRSGDEYPCNLGLILENVGFWDEYAGYDNLRLLASIRGLVGEGEIRRAMERVGLDPSDDRPFETYSLGMRQRLFVCRAFRQDRLPGSTTLSR